MKTICVSRSVYFTLGILLLITTRVALSQAVGASPQNAPPTVLGQLATAFSAGQVVQSIQISGTATWHIGSLEDTGTVNLTASTDGSAQMQLALAASGQRTESQTGTGLNSVCQWAGADGVAHAIQSGACLRPALWFLPALTLQPSLLASGVGVTDLGIGTVGSSTNSYRHLQSQLTINNASTSLAADFAQWSSTDIGLDPASLMPVVLSYSVHPDNGAQVTIPVEIHYSNYRTVNGVQIPFLIQRYVNGALQLEIAVNSAAIN